MKIQINKEVIEKLSPCKDRFDNFLLNYPSFDEDILKFLDLKNISHSDKLWVALRILPRDLVKVFAIDCGFSAQEYAYAAGYAATAAATAYAAYAAYAGAYAAYAANAGYAAAAGAAAATAGGVATEAVAVTVSLPIDTRSPSSSLRTATAVSTRTERYTETKKTETEKTKPQPHTPHTHTPHFDGEQQAGVGRHRGRRVDDRAARRMGGLGARHAHVAPHVARHGVRVHVQAHVRDAARLRAGRARDAPLHRRHQRRAHRQKRAVALRRQRLGHDCRERVGGVGVAHDGRQLQALRAQGRVSGRERETKRDRERGRKKQRQTKAV